MRFVSCVTLLAVCSISVHGDKPLSSFQNSDAARLRDLAKHGEPWEREMADLAVRPADPPL